MRNRIIAGLAGLALAVFGLVGPAAASVPRSEGVWSGHAAKQGVPPGYAVNLETGTVEKAAAVALASCAAGAICFYDNTDGTGLLEIDYASTHPKSLCFALQTANKNRTGYIVNNYGGYWWVYWYSGGCSQSVGTIYPVSSGPMNGSWNNVIDWFVRAT